ncbi:BEM_collapsed_G0022530.mRNA.1.CDS.1 [Saccharomyces cerevisiae]|nr:BEM_collapsed_G0022530.mRNA.1.CDS.1 [Saccharomyces cerevisiae]
MTDETAQPTQSASKQESAALKQTGDDQQESQQQRGYNNYNNGSNYTQKKPYNSNRPHQQRGGKFGPNRYNNRGNYNGGGSFRGGTWEPTAQTCHGLPQQMAAAGSAPANPIPVEEKSPVPTKIEITTKSGEHLDLKEQHKAKLQSQERSTVSPATRVKVKRNF